MLLPFSAPIVGARFRPPAADVLNLMAMDTHLACVREPLNPHDENAIKIMVHRNYIESILNVIAEDNPQAVEEISFDDEGRFHLGYVPRGKAEMLAPILDKGALVQTCKLSFNVEGRPQVELEIEDGEAA